jgi:serine O-acetyltransferase
MEVPFGLDGARRDFALYCRVHGARGLGARLVLPLRQPALLALWVYRYGRWVHFGGRPRPRTLHRALYMVLFELVRHATGVLIHRWCQLSEDVWIESFHPVLIGAHRIGKGSFLYGGVTIGAGGSRENRGVPSFGERVVLGPGSTCTGPVEVPSGSVLAANAVATRSLPKGETGWVGAPAREFAGPREALVPAIPGGAA